MTTVILAEKPSQARSYLEAFNRSEKKSGYYEVQDALFTDRTVVTYGFGHLVELAEPAAYNPAWEKWSLDQLPMLPRQFKFQLNAGAKEQFGIVKGLIAQADRIVIATDSDREGENIAWSILKYTGVDLRNKQIQRLWINSLEKQVVRTGFANLKPAQDYYNNYLEAQTRQLSDWLVGMNLTRLYTCVMQARGLRKTLTVGRVQTPTLALVYQRDQAIANFKPTPYEELSLQLGEVAARLDPAQKFKTPTERDQFLQTVNAQLGPQAAQVTTVEQSVKSTPSPRLFSLSGLQSELNKRWHLSASDALAAVQKLYEAKLLSYPRTDCPYITSAEFDYLKANLASYAEALGLSPALFTELEANKRYVDGSKVQEHHAIIPTREADLAKIKELDQTSQQVYTLVLTTTLAMFIRPYQYRATKATFRVGNANFTATGAVPINSGWHQLLGKSDQEKELPPLSQGAQVEANLTSEQKKTKPPKPFTEGTLITAMKTAGKTLTDTDAQAILKDVEGIGTEATRASILEELKHKGYLVVEKNKLHVTDLGQMLCRAIKTAPTLASAQMTAEWEKKLKAIGQGQQQQATFLQEINRFITELVKKVPAQLQADRELSAKLNQQAAERQLGSCPKCGQGQIVDKGKLYGCDHYPDCDFALFKTIAGRPFKPTEVKALLAKGQTKQLSGFKKKAGGTFKAAIKLNPTTYQTEFVFTQRKGHVKKND
ncbi:DNA topoisomerase 3 [Limosilactobacillus reuteri]|uniref:type IA DNA topoisomerase n=1 Tax=Limosilactobacillus reuteri TaxID=1598 RepID=UPI001E48C232|nr:type IA DNA topoisomerase [Limosilactobacillus reuteri]MCC4500287.1 DNA topoisomerase 3 [Limosilactobacillus reuteri]MCC4500612.1 DNA topoisomerase 3 [Limosilactobacillus reuteri]